MTYTAAQPELMTAASVNVAGIRSTISDATAAAAAPTTAVAAAAADEVSVATTAAFNAYAREYHAVLNQAANFHGEFARALAAAGNAYAEAETANAAVVSKAASAPAMPATVAAATAQNVTLIMGGTGTPLPQQHFVTVVFDDYVAPYFAAFNLGSAQALFTPEAVYPMDQSISLGVNILNNAILQQISAGNDVVVLGYSQSAVISSLEMQALATSPNPPSPSQLSFVLLGDPMNPNGGLMARFPGLTLPSLGLDFYGATPTNTIYPTHIYTIEYDGFADFPRYPLDVLSDLNAVAGISAVHGQYASIPSARLATAITLPTDPAYGTATTYSMLPTTNLPLLNGLRNVPVVGTPLADLLQPDLTVLVNLGYGDPAYGYSTGPANVPTPFGLFPPVSPATVLGDLATGAQQGIAAFVRDIGATGLPSFSDIVDAFGSTPLPMVHLPPDLTSVSIDSLFNGLGRVNTGVVDAVTRAFSAGYSTLLPTADIANALLTSVPSYDINLFLDGIARAANGDPMGLVTAIGNPIAVDIALVTLAGGFEGIALVDAGQSILEAFSRL